MASVTEKLELLVAGMPGVRNAREELAEELGREAQWRLGQHRETGDASIEVVHDRLDSYVVLDDDASLSIEFGRGEFTRPDGVKVGAMEGLHILRDTAGG